MYMSYCKFEGAKAELGSCLATVDEHVNEEARDEVSEREIWFFRSMVREFYDWMHDVCLLDFEGNLDEEVLDEICESMATCNREED